MQELKSWSMLCTKVVKSLQSHMAQRSHTWVHTKALQSGATYFRELLRPSDASVAAAGLWAGGFTCVPSSPFPRAPAGWAATWRVHSGGSKLPSAAVLMEKPFFHHMAVHAPIRLISVGRVKLSLTKYMQKTQGNIMKNSILEYPGKGLTWHARCFLFPFILFFHLCKLVQSH